MPQIRLEHAIGFLKGWFHSLKGLRVQIMNEQSHKFATYWVAACTGLHAFAMQCEDEDNSDSDGESDLFIAEGLSSSNSHSGSNIAPATTVQTARLNHLHEAQAQWEQLKKRLFWAKAPIFGFK